MKKKLLTVLLAMALTVTSVSPAAAQTTKNTDAAVTEEGASEQTAVSEQKMDRLEVTAQDTSGNQREISIDLSKKQNEIALQSDEESIEIKAFDQSGDMMTATRDFTITSAAGNKISFEQYVEGISVQAVCRKDDRLLVQDADGHKISVIQVVTSDNEDHIEAVGEHDVYADITVGNDQKVVLPDGGRVYYRFIPEVTGRYVITSSDASGDPAGYLYDESWEKLTDSDDIEDDYNFKMVWDLVAGKTYYIGAGTFDDEDSYTLSITRKKGFAELKDTATALTIPADSTQSETITLQAESLIEDDYDQLVSFTPAESGYYLFRVNGDKIDARKPSILDSDGVSHADTSIYYEYPEYRVYYAGAYLNKGELCYLALEYGPDEISSYEVSVSKKPAIKSIEPVLREDVSLTYGKGGAWVSYEDEDENTQRYYEFELQSVVNLYHYKVTYEDGTIEELSNDNPGRLFFTTNQSKDHPWLPDNADHILTIRGDGVDIDCNVTVLPKAKAADVTISLYNKDDYLTLGKDGSWTNVYDEATGDYNMYFSFYLSSIYSKYYVTITYEDGSSEKVSVSDIGDEEVVGASCSDNQSIDNPWLVDGKNNLLTVTVDDITKSVNVPVKSYLYDYKDCPALTEDVPCTVEYEDEADSGVLLFTPASANTYSFYSEGSEDTCIEVYDEYGDLIGRDDDGYNKLNFLLSLKLEAGKTYVIKTRTYSHDNGTYTVCATTKTIENSGYASLKGVDLRGKYINLALVVDTTGSMSDIIDNVRTHLTEFVDAIAETHATLRISLIDYKDITCNEATVLHYAKDYSLWFENDDIDELKRQIAALGADGGGDFPESVVDALGNVARPEIMMFNAAAAKFAFLVTDATYKEENTHGFADMDALIAALKTQNIATSVITEKDNYSSYQKLADETGGELINVNGDFANAMGRFAAEIAKGTADYVPDTSIIPVTSISLGSDLSVPEGKIRNFKPVILPVDATEKSVTWSVENPEIAQIDTTRTTENTLVVRGISAGSTRIIARTKDGGYAASFEFKVEKAVKTENTIESCDIASIMADLKDAGSARVNMIYYGDVVPTVSADDQITIYSGIAATDKNIAYVYSDADGDLLYAWKFNGKEIKDPSIAVNMETKINDAASIAASAAQSTGMTAYATIDFSHAGVLPGTAHISAAVNNLADGEYALYYYNPSTGKLELCDSTVKVSGSVAEFSITHCSSYVISNQAVSVQKIKITGDTKKVAAGKKITLKASVLPGSAGNKKLKWSSSNKKYATVNKQGVVTTKKAGAGKKVTITATATDGSKVKGTYKIQIVKHAVKKVSITTKNTTLKANKKLRLKTKVSTTGKTANKTLKFTSSNTKYADVNSKGVVTAKKAGKGKTVTITAKAVDGSGKSAKIKIKIKK